MIILKTELKRYNTSLCGIFFFFFYLQDWKYLDKLPDVVDSNTADQFKRKLDKVMHSIIWENHKKK